MSEFFLELFSEEIPASLQTKARESIIINFKNFFEKERIIYKDNIISFSTPNRLVVYVKSINKVIINKSEEIKGPSISAPQQAIDGFLKSNKIYKKNLFKKKLNKGEFYFFKKKSKKIETKDLLNENIPQILKKISWNKSMKWGEYDLFWGRPLKNILAIFDTKPLNFKFHHLISSKTTFIDKEFEKKLKTFKNYKSYISYFKKQGIIINNEIRKNFIVKELNKISKRKNLKINLNNKLLDEVTNLVEKPRVISCEFDKKFLEVPKEVLIITMQQHQKYFPSFDKNENLSNNFFLVSDIIDHRGLVKIGNERVVDARLNDANFFWKKNKSQSLLKQISKLKNINYFKNLGTYFDKIQRMRKLSGLISDELLISKEKIEIASSICKVDLVSDLVGEFPELQGVLGGYFAQAQGFEKEVCLAVSEHYLPTGNNSRIPKKPYSIGLSISDKLDTLVGFFAINLKPTSSKDPYALRRLAIGLIKIILENKIKMKIKDLINYSCQMYIDQGLQFETKDTQKYLIIFLNERFKNYMKEKGIRQDIIECATISYNIDDILKIFKKAAILNKLILKEIGLDIIFSYKRAYNILISEKNNPNFDLSGSVDQGLFKNDFEINLFKKIQDIRKTFTSVSSEDDYETQLKNLASIKKELTEFFDNVKVNEEEQSLKKNRLELLQMLCKTFDNYFNFSKLESS